MRLTWYFNISETLTDVSKRSAPAYEEKPVINILLGLVALIFFFTKIVQEIIKSHQCLECFETEENSNDTKPIFLPALNSEQGW